MQPTITVTNNHGGFCNLPYYHRTPSAIEGRPEDVDMRKVELKPGLNSVTLSDWEKVAEQSNTKKRIEAGELSVDVKFNVDDFSPKEFAAALKATASMEMMALMKGQTRKKEYRAAIEKRMADIVKRTESKG